MTFSPGSFSEEVEKRQPFKNVSMRGKYGAGEKGYLTSCERHVPVDTGEGQDILKPFEFSNYQDAMSWNMLVQQDWAVFLSASGWLPV